MKKSFYVAFAFVAVVGSQASASVSCQVLEGDGAIASGTTEILAKKAAWKQCISNKVSRREAYRGPVSVDDGIMDAESCMNAPVKCK